MLCRGRVLSGVFTESLHDTRNQIKRDGDVVGKDGEGNRETRRDRGEMEEMEVREGKF